MIIGSNNPINSQGNTQIGGSTAQSSKSSAQEFLDYMNESPAQRMEDAWLKSHHITKEDFAAMSPEKREAIKKQMAEDIKDEIKSALKEKAKPGQDAGLGNLL